MFAASLRLWMKFRPSLSPKIQCNAVSIFGLGTDTDEPIDLAKAGDEAGCGALFDRHRSRLAQC